MIIYQLKEYFWNGKDYEVTLRHQSQNLNKVMLVAKKYLSNGQDTIIVEKMEQDEFGELVSTCTFDYIDITGYEL